MVTGTRGKIDENLNCKNSPGLTGKLPKDSEEKPTNQFSTIGCIGVSALLTISLAIVFSPVAVASESGKELWHCWSLRHFAGRSWLGIIGAIWIFNLP